MNKLDKETFTRSDIESSLRKEFPNINKSDISDAIDAILDSITEAVALDEKVEIRGFGTFSKMQNFFLISIEVMISLMGSHSQMTNH